jgi:hypothetical protein
MSESLIARLQSFLDRLIKDRHSAFMFEADADTLRESVSRIKSDRYQFAVMDKRIAELEAERDALKAALAAETDRCARITEASASVEDAAYHIRAGRGKT